MKSRQISTTTNIHMYRFIWKCKNDLILPTDQSKSPKNDKNSELELLDHTFEILSCDPMICTMNHLKSFVTHQMAGVEMT